MKATKITKSKQKALLRVPVNENSSNNRLEPGRNSRSFNPPDFNPEASSLGRISDEGGDNVLIDENETKALDMEDSPDPMGNSEEMPNPPELSVLAKDPGKLAEYAEKIRGMSPDLDPAKIYVSISVNQRGDFHKFKWSIASSKLFHVFIPISQRKGDKQEGNKDMGLHKEQIYKAQALEELAPGQWSFINSYQIISKLNKAGNKGNEKGDGEDKKNNNRISMQGLKSDTISKMGGLAGLPEGEDGKKAIEAWAGQEMPPQTIHDLNSFVPLFNSELVKGERSKTLNKTESPKVSTIVDRLAAEIKGRDVLVLWGNRSETGAGNKKDFLKKKVAAREFRHRSSQELYQELSAAATSKLIIKAGDPLPEVKTAIDLTELWDEGEMNSRFKVKGKLDRFEQETLFFKLATLAKSTLHVGMQSGNIEPLINNPNTNVICLNENSKGGAGLSNVDKISGSRERVLLGSIKDDKSNSQKDNKAKKGNESNSKRKEPFDNEKGEVQNLYLSFKLKVLPSFIGELSRIIMERYGESVAFDAGMINLLKDCGLSGEDEPKDVETGVKQLVDLYHKESAGEVEKPAMLGNFNSKDHRAMILTLYHHYLKPHGNGENDKALTSGNDATASESSGSIKVAGQLRPEIELLKLLVESSNPRVQYFLKTFAKVVTTEGASLKEKALKKVLSIVASRKMDYFNLELLENQGKMPSDDGQKLDTYIQQAKNTLSHMINKDSTKSLMIEKNVANLEMDRKTIQSLQDEAQIKLATGNATVKVKKVKLWPEYMKLKHSKVGQRFDSSFFEIQDLNVLLEAARIVKDNAIQEDLGSIIEKNKALP